MSSVPSECMEFASRSKSYRYFYYYHFTILQFTSTLAVSPLRQHHYHHHHFNITPIFTSPFSPAFWKRSVLMLLPPLPPPLLIAIILLVVIPPTKSEAPDCFQNPDYHNFYITNTTTTVLEAVRRFQFDGWDSY